MRYNQTMISFIELDSVQVVSCVFSLNILSHFSTVFCLEKYENQKNKALRINSSPLGRASPNTIVWLFEKFLWCKDVKYECLLENDDYFKINAFLSKRARSARPAAHSLPVSRPCKITHVCLTEITGHKMKHFSY